MDKKVVFRIIAIVFVVVETFSIIHGYLFNRLSIPTVLLCVFSTLLYPSAFFNKQTLYFALYSLVLFMYAVIGHTLVDKTYLLSNIFEPLSCLALINVFLYNKDMRGLKIVTGVGLVIILVTAIATIPLLIIFPNAVRSYAGFSDVGDYDSIQFLQKLGIASFGLTHSLPFLFPILIYRLVLEKKKLVKLLYAILIVVPFSMVILSNVTTSLIFSTLGIFTALSMFIKNKFLVYLILFSTVFILLVFGNEVIVTGLNVVQPFFEETPTYDKIDEIRNSIINKEPDGDVDARSELYKLSWYTFSENPIFGNMDKYNIGGHAYFVDRLAAFGVFGNIFFYMFIYTTFYIHYNILHYKARKFYIIGVVMFIVFGFLKNITGIENYFYLFVILLSLGLMPETTLNNYEQINSVKHKKEKNLCQTSVVFVLMIWAQLWEYV